MAGFLVEFIAAPVIAGFSTAAALTIGTTQIKPLLGLKFSSEGFLETWKGVFQHIGETKPWDALMGFSSVIILLVLRVSHSLVHFARCFTNLSLRSLIESRAMDALRADDYSASFVG